MARDFFVNGECLVLVKGCSDTVIGTLTELGLASDPIVITPNYLHKDINVDAWGAPAGGVAEVQAFLADVTITMNLIHLDRDVLDVCLGESLGGVNATGQLARSGERLGNNKPRFFPGGPGVGNHYIGLNLTSPVGGKPWRFFYTYLVGQPMSMPLGTEKSIVSLTWRAIPYTQDPYGGSASQPNTVYGTGARNALLWDHVLDT